jgi:2-oxoglutarate dehydrogenase E2 component (dihydrolipoamide succinyltransferase)
MPLVNIIMPKLGEGIMEATVLRWLKKPGEWVKYDESLLEIATDKVDSEVPSTAEGFLEAVFCNENDIIAIGSVIATIRTDGDDQLTDQPTSPQIIKEEINDLPLTSVEHQAKSEADSFNPSFVPYQPSQQEMPPKQTSSMFYSPLVMNIAASEGIDFSELAAIQGTGNDGRVSKKDLLDYIERKKTNPSSFSQQTQGLEAPKANDSANTPVQANIHSSSTDYSQSSVSNENVEIIEMDRMRKLISEHMTRSLSTSAHVTSFAEADVTNLVKWREKIKGSFEKREGEKITYTPIFIDAITKSIKRYPLLNASVSGDKILLKKDINIGMATALPNGNLIVPVIKNADQLSMLGLVKQVNKMANLARNGKLQPADTQNGTFTFTNIGTFGSLMGTPVINQPQVAILAVGAIKKKPVVIESEKGDSIAIRHMMFVSMSYDHRIIDGGLGSQFLASFVNALESFDINSSF